MSSREPISACAEMPSVACPLNTGIAQKRDRKAPALRNSARSFPHSDRRSCPGYAPVSSLKVLEGVWGNFFQEVPPRALFILLLTSSQQRR